MRVLAVTSMTATRPLFKGKTNKVDVEKKNILKVKSVYSQPIKSPLFK